MIKRNFSLLFFVTLCWPAHTQCPNELKVKEAIFKSAVFFKENKKLCFDFKISQGINAFFSLLGINQIAEGSFCKEGAQKALIHMHRPLEYTLLVSENEVYETMDIFGLKKYRFHSQKAGSEIGEFFSLLEDLSTNDIEFYSKLTQDWRCTQITKNERGIASFENKKDDSPFSRLHLNFSKTDNSLSEIILHQEQGAESIIELQRNLALEKKEIPNILFPLPNTSPENIQRIN
jgi:hypothetical protein